MQRTELQTLLFQVETSFCIPVEALEGIQGKMVTMTDIGIGMDTGEMRSSDNYPGTVNADSVQFSHNPFQVFKMLEYMAANHHVKDRVFKRQPVPADISQTVGVRAGVYVHPKRITVLKLSASDIQDLHRTLCLSPPEGSGIIH